MDKLEVLIAEEYERTIIPSLVEYIKIDCQSPHFDKEWATNGKLEAAFGVLTGWLQKQAVHGLKWELDRTEGRTPFLLCQIEGTTATPNTVLMYGHMDKQPPMLPWAEGLGPYTPVIRDNKLYGRGGADDGYSLFGAVTAVAKMQELRIPHARTVIIIEAAEESGSPDLEYYVTKHKNAIGNVDLVICLDSGAMNYDTIWLTNSLRGLASGVLEVRTLQEPCHSGTIGGVAPDAFRIARQLLDRIENSYTGKVLLPEAWVEVPQSTIEGMQSLNQVDYLLQFPLLPGIALYQRDNVELALRNAWEPNLTVIGCNLPPIDRASNLCHGVARLKLSFRTPPTANAKRVNEAVKAVLERDPPQNAQVTYSIQADADGWTAPSLSPWLQNSLQGAAMRVFKKQFGLFGLGASIPFMGMLGRLYPQAQFVVTGVLGPQSNAHGPNEFLHIPFVKQITTCVAQVLADHYTHTPK